MTGITITKKQSYELPNGLIVNMDYGFDEKDNFFLNGIKVSGKTPKNKAEYYMRLFQVCDVFDRFFNELNLLHRRCYENTQLGETQ